MVNRERKFLQSKLQKNSQAQCKSKFPQLPEIKNINKQYVWTPPMYFTCENKNIPETYLFDSGCGQQIQWLQGKEYCGCSFNWNFPNGHDVSKDVDSWQPDLHQTAHLAQSVGSKVFSSQYSCYSNKSCKTTTTKSVLCTVQCILNLITIILGQLTKHRTAFDAEQLNF